MLRVLLPNTQPETQDVSRLALPNTASPAYSLIAELADQFDGSFREKASTLRPNSWRSTDVPILREEFCWPRTASLGLGRPLRRNGKTSGSSRRRKGGGRGAVPQPVPDRHSPPSSDRI